MDRKNIIVYPSTSVIGQEICRALFGNKEFNVYPLTSEPFRADNEGEYCSRDFLKQEVDRLVKTTGLNTYIFPANDEVQYVLSQTDIPIIGSSNTTIRTCRLKSKTYEAIHYLIPQRFSKEETKLKTKKEYPFFIKPDRGQGSKGTWLLKDKSQIKLITSEELILEYLPGVEYTIDCFTKGDKVVFFEIRERVSIANGISTTTRRPSGELKEHLESWLLSYAEKIQAALPMKGAWFFQMKNDKNGNPKLLEVAPRISGNSSFFRHEGVNLPLLTLYEFFEIPYEFPVQTKVLLFTMYKKLVDIPIIHINPIQKGTKIYVDWDDTLIINGILNWKLAGWLLKKKQEGHEVNLITRSQAFNKSRLEILGIDRLFDNCFKVKQGEKKSKYVIHNSIAIDDSYSERLDLSSVCRAVFGIDQMELLFTL